MLWDLATGIFDGIVGGVKSLFGINSPSTVMAEQGEYMMQGLQEGIEDNEESIFDKIGNIGSTIGDTLSDAWDLITNNTDEVWEGIKGVITGNFTDSQEEVEKTSKEMKEQMLRIFKRI